MNNNLSIELVNECIAHRIKFNFLHSVPLNGPFPLMSKTNSFIFSAYLPVKFNFGKSNVKLNFIFGISALKTKNETRENEFVIHL